MKQAGGRIKLNITLETQVKSTFTTQNTDNFKQTLVIIKGIVKLSIEDLKSELL